MRTMPVTLGAGNINNDLRGLLMVSARAAMSLTGRSEF